MKKTLLTFWALLLFITSLYAQGPDLNILKGINGPISPGADKSWRFITKKAIYVDAAVPAGLLIAGFVNHDDDLKISGLQAGASILVAGGSTFLLKKVFGRTRPYIAHPDVITVKEFPGPTDASFPSGHTSFAFAAATSLSLAVPKWYVIAPSFLYAGAVGYSRMYLGVHYPSDVLGGAVVGVGSAYITWKAQQWLTGKKHKKTYPE
ncbi:phosphatase PAP2 family protein [Mucilaginibacter pocheonensis]|uniref:Undecaprenyl-diphosphatase n=1 Tax=Mucilaginibacter pocheonensis TaxID=398050 RepID=A0ABU1T5S7_9SPHI|nr:phosphatase PAP2 family protein [Mucilaginibacter pocheonensis]MDR6940601.1 undecaprenyl-diphosphatase [Mucilaginibacter pocheonensis]